MTDPFRLLVGVDREGCARDAAGLAIALAAALEGEVHLAHVLERTRKPWPFTPPLPEAEVARRGHAVLTAALGKLPEGAHFHAAQGHPARELSRLGDEIGADLLILGRHNEGAFDPLLGGTASRILREVSGPVMVHRASSTAVPHRFLVPVDLSSVSRRALALAISLASRVGGFIDLLYVFEPPGFAYPTADADIPNNVIDAIRQEEFAGFRKLAGTTPWCGVAHEVTTVEGDPGPVILEQARRVECDAIVMGTRGRAGLKRMLLGSVAEYVVRRSDASVVVTPPDA